MTPGLNTTEGVTLLSHRPSVLYKVEHLATEPVGGDIAVEGLTLAGPGWQGQRPEGIQSIIPCETELALDAYRTQLFNPDDLDNVKQVQSGYQVQTLSEFLGHPAPAAPPKK